MTTDNTMHAADSMTLTAGNGARVTLRGLDRKDAGIYGQHLLRLSPAGRRARFHNTLADDSVTAHARGLDWRLTYVFGAFIGGQLRGAGELDVMRDGKAGEISVSVEEPFQHAGLGKILVLAAVLAARRLGLTQIQMMYLPENDRMRALARDVGARIEAEPGVRIAIMDIPQTG